MKRILQLLILSFTFCLLSCTSTRMAAGSLELKQQLESEHFIFYCLDRDANVLDRFQDQLESGYAKIASDIDFQLSTKVIVEIYPNISTLHAAVGIPGIPDWVAAYTSKRGENTAIMVVSPNNPGKQHTGDFILNRVLVHELAQSMIFGKHNRRPPIWLFKGLASYEGNNLTGEEIRQVISKEVEAGKVPTLLELQPANDEKVPEQVFNDLNGYEYSFTIVEFIVEEFGMAKVRELLDSQDYPFDYPSIFGLSESAFYKAWVAFLEENYL